MYMGIGLNGSDGRNLSGRSADIHGDQRPCGSRCPAGAKRRRGTRRRDGKKEIMYITALTPEGKTKTGVTFDEDVTLILSNTEIAARGIELDAEIVPEVYEELYRGVKKEALHKSAALLQGMDYTEQGLRTKLIRSGYPEEIAQETAAAVRDAGLVNDLRYAQNYIQYHMTDRSRLRLRADLLGKGVKESLIDEAFRLWEEDHAAQAPSGGPDGESPAEAAELEQIRRILRKRRYDPDSASREDEHKLIAFLQYKGYSLSVIRRALKGSDIP